jgi:hypothetical protein
VKSWSPYLTLSPTQAGINPKHLQTSSVSKHAFPNAIAAAIAGALLFAASPAAAAASRNTVFYWEPIPDGYRQLGYVQQELAGYNCGPYKPKNDPDAVPLYLMYERKSKQKLCQHQPKAEIVAGRRPAQQRAAGSRSRPTGSTARGRPAAGRCHRFSNGRSVALEYQLGGVRRV